MLYAVEALGKSRSELELCSGTGAALTILGQLLQADAPAAWAINVPTKALIELIRVGCVAHLFEPQEPGVYKLVGYRITKRGKLLFHVSTMAGSHGPPKRGA